MSRRRRVVSERAAARRVGGAGWRSGAGRSAEGRQRHGHGRTMRRRGRVRRSAATTAVDRATMCMRCVCVDVLCDGVGAGGVRLRADVGAGVSRHRSGGRACHCPGSSVRSSRRRCRVRGHGHRVRQMDGRTASVRCGRRVSSGGERANNGASPHTDLGRSAVTDGHSNGDTLDTYMHIKTKHRSIKTHVDGWARLKTGQTRMYTC